MSDVPATTVVIVNYNTRARLLAALDSILPEAAGGGLKVIVVDNASIDDSAAAAAAHPIAPQVVRAPYNQGFAAGVNRGLAVAAPGSVILLNSDARVLPGGLARLADYLAAHPEVGLAGGRVVNPDGSHQPTAFSTPTLFESWREFSFLGGRLRPAPDRTGPVDWVSGAFLALASGLYQEVGGLDERFFLYGEDIDYGVRVRRAGRAVHYVAEAQAVHETRGSEQRGARWSPRAVKARWLFHRKFEGRTAATLLRAAWTVVWLLALPIVAAAALLPGAAGSSGRGRLGRLLNLILSAGDAPPPGPARVALIAIVDFPNGVGGDTRRVHMLCRALLSAGYPTTLLIPCPRGLVADAHRDRARELIDDIDVERLSRQGSYGHEPGLGARGAMALFLLRWIVLFRTLARVVSLRRAGMRTLYLYQPTFYDGAALWLLARMIGCRIVADYCDLSFVDHDRIERSLARRLWSWNYRLGMTWLPPHLDRAFVISTYLFDRMAERVPAGRLARIPPVVDVDAFDVEPGADFFATRCGAPQGRVVLYAGSFFDNEGVAVLLAAVPLVLKRVPEAFFLIVGGHPVEVVAALQQQAATPAMGGRVRFVGVAPSVDMPLYFRAAEVLVAPKIDSPLNRAGVPTKLVEYLASGRPVVASAVGDIPLLVEADKEALLVPPGEPAALAGAIVRLLDDPLLAKRLGAAGRLRVRRDFDVRAVGRLIREALERPARSGSGGRSAGLGEAPQEEDHIP